MKQDKKTIKTYFETGDKPTQKQFENLIDSYVDSKQPKGETNRRFIIDETGEVSVTSEQKFPEYTFSEITGNKLALLKDGITVKEIDLTPYIDDTNLARLISGTVDTNGIATFTRDDNSTFTVDLSNLKNTQIQSDWNQTDNSQPNFIKNKPSISNTLPTNFYEEGTFTPAFNGLGANYTATGLGANYIRVGNIVTVNINASGINGNTGEFSISLPFTDKHISTAGIIRILIGSNLTDIQKGKLKVLTTGNNMKIIQMDNDTVMSSIGFTNGGISAQITFETNVYTP
ncbi:hypothetical protein DS884_06820 [Tenacibaculum sp. E3R01]|uniref:hypothetical protein n=1 Tax=Tenacibaculum sp. E3R01 TaxID=2267227 RepID=UPI000DE9032F|nr:hypothetical protein [Tenacibaculum sp. E3R01]RBW59446.1 hypothetical protein DS884_06820 [Tenacibaculum sp. E3R01]